VDINPFASFDTQHRRFQLSEYQCDPCQSEHHRKGFFRQFGLRASAGHPGEAAHLQFSQYDH
jgi:hypothetical protein